MSKSSTSAKLNGVASHFAIALVFLMMFILVLGNLHALAYSACRRLTSSPPARSSGAAGRAEVGASPPMRWYQHAASAVDTIFDDNEVIVAGKLVLIYAVQTTLLGRAAKAVAIRQETCILGEISCRSRGSCSDSHIGPRSWRTGCLQGRGNHESWKS